MYAYFDPYRVTLFGHRYIDRFREVDEGLDRVLNELVLQHPYIDFYIGNDGDFDRMATSAIRRLIQRCGKENITINLVFAYPKADIDKYPDYSYEKALEVQDMISDLEAKYQASDLYFEQDTLDIYRPGIPHDQRWAAITFVELMFYAMSPDIYIKDVYEMMPDKDSECARMQTKT